MIYSIYRQTLQSDRKAVKVHAAEDTETSSIPVGSSKLKLGAKKWKRLALLPRKSG